jgi:hypothetical protein
VEVCGLNSLKKRRTRKFANGRRTPRAFTEVGKAIRAGRSWDVGWGDWLYEFVRRKDARNLADWEPPSSFSAQREAMMAWTAEFFANLYELPRQPGSTNRNTS